MLGGGGRRWDMVCDPTSDDAVRWSPSGMAVEVWNRTAVEGGVLGSFFCRGKLWNFKASAIEHVRPASPPPAPLPCRSTVLLCSLSLRCSLMMILSGVSTPRNFPLVFYIFSYIFFYIFSFLSTHSNFPLRVQSTGLWGDPRTKTGWAAGRRRRGRPAGCGGGRASRCRPT